MTNGGEVIHFPVSRRPIREAINADLDHIGVSFQLVSEAAVSAQYDVLARLKDYGTTPLQAYLDDFLVQSAPTTKVVPASALKVESAFDVSPTGLFVNYSRDIDANTISTIRANTFVPTTAILHYHRLMADALRDRNLEEGLVTRLALKWTFYSAAAQAIVGLVSAAYNTEGIGYEEWIGKLRNAFPGTTDVYNNPPSDDSELKMYYETLKPSRLVFGMGLDMLLNTPTRDMDVSSESRHAVSRIVRAHQVLLGRSHRNNIMASSYLLAAATPASIETIRSFFAAANAERL